MQCLYKIYFLNFHLLRIHTKYQILSADCWHLSKLFGQIFIFIFSVLERQHSSFENRRQISEGAESSRNDSIVDELMYVTFQFQNSSKLQSAPKVLSDVFKVAYFPIQNFCKNSYNHFQTVMLASFVLQHSHLLLNQ